MTNNIHDFEKALDEVKPDDRLTRAVVNHTKQILVESGKDMVCGGLSAADAVSLSNIMGSGWKFSKVKALVQAMRQNTHEEAHQDVCKILLEKGRHGQDYTGQLLKDPVTGKITEMMVQISGSGLHLVLGYHNDELGVAYKRYVFACFEALVKEVSYVAKYYVGKKEQQEASTEVFNVRKRTLESAGCSPHQAQAASARIDKKMNRAVFGLMDSNISATQAMKDAGMPCKRGRIVQSLNFTGAFRAAFLRNETAEAMAIADNDIDFEKAASDVIDAYAPHLVQRDPRTGVPIGHRRQVRRMCSDKVAKRILQAQGRLDGPRLLM